jgi:hypothetical protein
MHCLTCLQIAFGDKRLTAALSTAAGALAAAIAAWQTPGIPVTEKANMTMAAIIAVSAVWSVWMHTEGQITRDKLGRAAGSPPTETGSEVVDLAMAN